VVTLAKYVAGAFKPRSTTVWTWHSAFHV